MGKGTIYKSEGKRIITQHYDNYLKSFQFNVEQKYVNTSYGKTHILVAGPPEGKPIFIFQGGNCINPMTLSWFLPLVDKYRVYAPDTIGHPGYSSESRISAKDNSFAQWIKELMDYFNIDSSAFVGPSYGAGIILRLATFMPDKIDCSVLVSPAGIRLGSKIRMIKDILLPLVLFNGTSSQKYLNKITDTMSDNSMREIDKKIIGDVFKYIRLEQEMPKLTTKEELSHYSSPTLIIAGKKDIFFPESRLNKVAREIIPNLIAFKTYDMGHFPSEEHLIKINNDIVEFLKAYY
ncbi:alpha/beta hydrolase [Heyndrickxia oleronia]|uniref:Alpha/beta hydrolase n=1 Tax=Heyndrickxia oleronia TaxID=38875 RepID=A0AAW6SN65_9BACI|nr:alpha/beta hydrolase [Heyndrickxia oleronia]MCM3236564.1 alpha/beta hydrolase [Heyndrickxia oleronia]MDH5159588.1 alpha/beta hydrolase [Heyndrickxia oleronia]